MPTPNPQTDWMVAFAFWASLILTLIKIVEAIITSLRQPSLNFSLTREVFFRLTEFGEALFCNPVLLAWNGPVLISSITACLKKTDSPQKSFPLKVLAFGEKVRGQGPFADHYFHSKSPIAHIPPGNPQRAVYFCVQEEYQDRTKQVIETFRQKILDFKAGLLSKAGNSGQFDSQEVLKGLVGKVDGALTEFMDLVQLEPGQYQLSVEIEYCNPTSRFWRRQKKASSTISFFVEPNVRDLLRTSLRETLMVGSSNTIYDRNQAVVYPEYQPIKVVDSAK